MVLQSWESKQTGSCINHLGNEGIDVGFFVVVARNGGNYLLASQKLIYFLSSLKQSERKQNKKNELKEKRMKKIKSGIAKCLILCLEPWPSKANATMY